MSKPTLEDRVKGCLTGAVIGAELGFARYIHPDWFTTEQPADIFDLELRRPEKRVEDDCNLSCIQTPLIGLGVQAYLRKQGRVTPEDFAAVLKDDPELAGPVFMWDPLHTTIELLKEGMSPRLSGLGSLWFGGLPCGVIAASMPAVGIYHFDDPDYAYLDGVELASVSQPRTGADWSALCASAIAAAFNSASDADVIVERVLAIARRNAPELFGQLNQMVCDAEATAAKGAAQFAEWWLRAAAGDARGTGWNIAFSPLQFVLPLLKHFAADDRKFFPLLVCPPPVTGIGGAEVSAIIGGAIFGALYGIGALPEEWRNWAEPVAAHWYPLVEVVQRRLQSERQILSLTQRMTDAECDTDSLLFDKVYGCLLASSIGNAMGSYTERLDYWVIDEQHPGGIKTVLEPSRLETEDDNQAAMLLADAYLKHKGLPLMARQFGEYWIANNTGISAEADLLRAGWDPRITGHWAQVTGAAVMCMEPVGIYHALDPEFAAIDAVALSYLYQRGLDVVTPSILAAAVAHAFRPDATVDSVLQTALDYAPHEPLRTFDKRPFRSVHHYLEVCLEVADKYNDVLAARAELYEKCLCYHHIDPLEVLGLALAMFKIAKGDVREAAIGGTNIGRDADTIAGRASMLSGALNGAGGVPVDWIALFNTESLDRIKRSATEFVHIVLLKEERMKQRAAVCFAETHRSR